MSLQRRVDRMILDLEDIRDAARYTNEVKSIDEALEALRNIRIWSDAVDC